MRPCLSRLGFVAGLLSVFVLASAASAQTVRPPRWSVEGSYGGDKLDLDFVSSDQVLTARSGGQELLQERNNEVPSDVRPRIDLRNNWAVHLRYAPIPVGRLGTSFFAHVGRGRNEIAYDDPSQSTPSALFRGDGWLFGAGADVAIDLDAAERWNFRARWVYSRLPSTTMTPNDTTTFDDALAPVGGTLTRHDASLTSNTQNVTVTIGRNLGPMTVYGGADMVFGSMALDGTLGLDVSSPGGPIQVDIDFTDKFDTTQVRGLVGSTVRVSPQVHLDLRAGFMGEISPRIWRASLRYGWK